MVTMTWEVHTDRWANCLAIICALGNHGTESLECFWVPCKETTRISIPSLPHKSVEPARHPSGVLRELHLFTDHTTAQTTCHFHPGHTQTSDPRTPAPTSAWEVMGCGTSSHL